MPKDSSTPPAYVVPVFRAEQFSVVDGVNLDDPLSVADEILLDDSYALGSGAKLRRLRIQATEGEQYRVDPTSKIGTPGNVLHLDCMITLMSQHGGTVDAFVVVEVDTNDNISDIYLLPIALLTQRTNYAVVGIDKTLARQRLAQAACVSFTRGTRITTGSGTQIFIEDLAVGDKVRTRDNGVQEIRWIGENTARAVGPYAPIQIEAGTFNNERDLVISPDHRLFCYEHSELQWAGRSDQSVKARNLINGTSVTALHGGFVDYFQLLFDNHQIIYAEGIAAESMGITPITRQALPEDIGDLLDTDQQQGL